MKTDTKFGWLSAATFVVPLLLSGCYSGVDVDGDGDSANADTGDSGDSSDGGPGDGPGAAPLDGPDECVEARGFFEDVVYRPVLQGNCFACHNPNGEAKHTSMVLMPDDMEGYLETNFNTVRNVARVHVDGKSLILRKPSTDGVAHEGGKKLAEDSEDYELLAELAELMRAPVHCEDPTDIEAYFDGIVEHDPVETLRKSVFLLGSRFPTPEEIDAVEAGGIEAMDQVLDSVMQEEAFYTRVKEIYNDRLHTDSYLPGDTALAAMDPERYPEANTFYGMDMTLRNAANDAVAREPLNIIENVLRKDAPFTEIILGDYTMVNPFSAQAYGLDPAALGFADPTDPGEFVEHNFDDIPQAGIITTLPYLNKYDNTPTNRNRLRSRFLFDFFGGEDVQRLAARPIDIAQVQGTNPTLFDANCSSCHDYIDPVAGAFQNYSYEGWYRPGNAWFGDMVPPGYAGEEIAPEDAGRSLPWIAEKLVEDENKFSLSVVYTIYKGLTGADPLVPPLDPTMPFYLQQVRAFDAQDYTFKQIAKLFEDSQYDLRVLVKALVKTHWFRAINTETDMDDERRVELAPMGSARVLPPEALDRKIRATVGFPWMRGGNNALLSDDEYFLFFGGIDSVNTTNRQMDINGIMNNVAERMSQEVACDATAFDFTKAPEDRLLFPFVEPGDGLDNEAQVRENIRYLHFHVLGENLDDNDPELDHTFQLFQQVLQDGQTKLDSGEFGNNLRNQCQATTDPVTGDALGNGITADPDYTVRAWMAVVTYLLGDSKYLFE